MELIKKITNKQIHRWNYSLQSTFSLDQRKNSHCIFIYVANLIFPTLYASYIFFNKIFLLYNRFSVSTKYVKNPQIWFFIYV